MSQPNLLFLYTDEQRFDTLACYGNEQIDMPNLNRLAERSVVFDDAYVTQPVCTPSRSTLLTGLFPHTNGCVANNVPLPTEVACLPEMLYGDYATAHYGKWHLGDEIFAQHGFADWRGIEDQYRPYYSEGKPRDALSHYQRWLIDEHGLKPKDGDFFKRLAAARLPEELSKPAYLAQEATRFLRDHRNDPFMLYVNFLEPHMPFTGPRDGQYDPDDIPLPPNFENPPGPDIHLRPRVRHLHYARQYDSERKWRELRARYWGLCSQVDTHAGRILDALDELGLADNTIVVFTSDHGDMMGSHQLVAKTVMYQESVRVPLLVRLPGQASQRRVNGPVSQVDVVPTLLELMGEDVPSHLEGQSLAPLMGQGGRADRDVIIEWNGADGAAVERPDYLADTCTPEEYHQAMSDPVRTIITPDGWRFSCSPMGQHELYHLGDDPHETTNLARQSDRLPLMRELRSRIAAWQQRTGDEVELPDL
jgi:arylsulfatase